ncbi:MAG TPA: Gfo/Idh/MocA family oxidoreductase [Xanthobacteraceae bacterium]|nr:Gfo/Idh/MocA family oxidoreductase [Xanthobacteraceae bacterium]
MKVGIVGCGLVGCKRAAAMGAHAVALVADTDAARARALAEATGARATSSWRDVVNSDVDIVVVATRHDTLAEIGLAAVVAGKHTLIEKPAGRRAAELLPIKQASERNGAKVKVGYNHRFHPALLRARELVDEGVLGPLMYVRGRYGHGGRRGMEHEWRCQEELSGGGELIDQGVHLIDLARWFLGELRLDYGATPTSYWPIAVDDNCFLALRGAGGEMAWLHASWSEWKNMFSFEIYGRDGKLAVEGLGGSYGLERLTFHRMLPQMGPPETKSWEFPAPDRSWELEFEEFVRAIEEDRTPLADISDGCAALKLVDEIYARGVR